MQQDLDSIDSQIAALAATYLDLKAYNFENPGTTTDATSALSLFSTAVWAPTALTGTTINTFNTTSYEMIGNRLEAATELLDYSAT